MKVFIVGSVFIALLQITWADVSAFASAPYQSAGWRPAVSFTLPQQQSTFNNNNNNIEVTKENIQFLGQVQSVVPIATASASAYATPNTVYLPPQQQQAQKLQVNHEWCP